MVKLAGNGRGRKLGRTPILKLIEIEKHEGGVRSIHKTIDRQPRETDHIRYPRGLARDVRHLPDNFIRAVERSTVRQLRKANQVLFVGAGDKATGH